MQPIKSLSINKATDNIVVMNKVDTNQTNDKVGFSTGNVYDAKQDVPVIVSNKELKTSKEDYFSKEEVTAKLESARIAQSEPGTLESDFADKPQNDKENIVFPEVVIEPASFVTTRNRNAHSLDPPFVSSRRDQEKRSTEVEDEDLKQKTGLSKTGLWGIIRNKKSEQPSKGQINEQGNSPLNDLSKLSTYSLDSAVNSVESMRRSIGSNSGDAVYISGPKRKGKRGLKKPSNKNENNENEVAEKISRAPAPTSPLNSQEQPAHQARQTWIRGRKRDKGMSDPDAEDESEEEAEEEELVVQRRNNWELMDPIHKSQINGIKEDFNKREIAYRGDNGQNHGVGVGAFAVITEDNQSESMYSEEMSQSADFELGLKKSPIVSPNGALTHTNILPTFAPAGVSLPVEPSTPTSTSADADADPEQNDDTSTTARTEAFNKLRAVRGNSFMMRRTLSMNAAFENLPSKRKERKAKYVSICIKCIIGLPVITAIIASIFIFGFFKLHETPDTAVDPPVLPRTLDNFIEDVLPPQLVELVKSNTESAQSKALLWLDHNPNLSSLSNSQFLVRFVLATLYYSTNGDLWKNKHKWLDHDVSECCDWYSDVSSSSVCNFNNSFRSIQLQNNALNGTLPYQLSLLSSHLRRIDLSKNQLSGSIPSGIFERLTRLSSLNLGYNRLSGTIAASDLDSLNRLLELDISHNLINGTIPNIGGLSHLEQLYMHDNSLTGTLPQMGQLSDLISIHLNDNRLNGTIYTDFGNLRKIRALNLASNQISGSLPTELGKFSRIEYLYLNYNKINGSIPIELGLLDELIELKLDQNDLTGTIPSHLEELRKMTTFDISVNQIVGTLPEQIGQLLSLVSFCGRKNNLNGVLPTSLGALSNIEILDLSYNNLNGTIGIEIGALESIKEMILNYNAFSGTMPQQLGGLNNLELLRLDANNFSGVISPMLGELRNLKELHLNQNALSGSIPLELGKLRKIKQLHLHRNNLSLTIPSELGKLRKVNELYLNQNDLSGSLPSELGNMQGIRKLRAYQNNLHGQIPSELGNLNKILDMKLHKNFLSGNMPTELGKLEDIRTLWLRSNQLTGFIPTNFGNMSSIEELYLDYNLLSGTIPNNLVAALSSITILHLNANNLNGSLPTQLDELTSAKNLLLDQNFFTGTIPTRLGQLSKLEKLYLSSNKFSGNVPSELGLLTDLQRLQLHDNTLSGSVPEELCELLQLGRLQEITIDCAMVNCSCGCRCADDGGYPLNGNCRGSVPLKIGVPYRDSTPLATPDNSEAGLCRLSESINRTISARRGLWFSVTGTGSMLKASTCSPWTSFDTITSIYTGRCGDLVCVDSNDDNNDCGIQSEIKWASTLGSLYYIFVDGVSTEVGDFQLTIEEV